MYKHTQFIYFLFSLFSPVQHKIHIRVIPGSLINELKDYFDYFKLLIVQPYTQREIIIGLKSTFSGVLSNRASHLVTSDSRKVLKNKYMKVLFKQFFGVSLLAFTTYIFDYFYFSTLLNVLFTQYIFPDTQKYQLHFGCLAGQENGPIHTSS